MALSSMSESAIKKVEPTAVPERFDIQKQAVYANYKHDKPITKFKWEGLNFVKL